MNGGSHTDCVRLVAIDAARAWYYTLGQSFTLFICEVMYLMDQRHALLILHKLMCFAVLHAFSLKLGKLSIAPCNKPEATQKSAKTYRAFRAASSQIIVG